MGHTGIGCEPRGVDIIHLFLYALTVWPLHWVPPCSFSRSEVGYFTCIGCDSPIHGTDADERLRNEDKARLSKGATAPEPGFEPGTSGMEVRGLNHSATTAPHHCMIQNRNLLIENSFSRVVADSSNPSPLPYHQHGDVRVANIFLRLFWSQRYGDWSHICLAASEYWVLRLPIVCARI